MDYQTMLEADRNRYLTGANRAADYAQRYEEYLTNERNAIRDLEQNGPSARSLAPMLGQFAAQNYASEGAERSNTAANLSRRGISPTSGLALGAEAAVDQGLAATRGQQSSAVMNQVMDMLQQRRGAMLGIDAAGRKSALDREESMMDTASTLGLKGREMDMTERRYNDLRDQQMFERRQAEQASLGRFAGQFGPGIMGELQRVRDRNNPAPAMTSDQIVEDFRNAERRAAVPAMADGGAGLIEQPLSFGDFGARPSGQSPIYEITRDTDLLGLTPGFRQVAPELMNGISPRRTSSIEPQSGSFGDLESLMGIGDFTGGRNIGTVGFATPNNMAQGNVLSQDNETARNDVFNMQNPYALDGQIIEFQGQFFRKTPNGWEQLG
jgi:hypothetical protein